jgi:N-acetylglutamate synthase-like GNAT family acetyltransferase
MNEYGIIKEAIFYSNKYRYLPLAIFLGKENTEKCQERGILRDIRFLKQLGLGILIGHYATDIDTKNWHDISDIISFCDCMDISGIKKSFSSGLIPVVYCEDNGQSSSYEAIALLAANLKLQKLIFITRQDGVYDTKTGKLISQMNTKEAQDILDYSDNVTLRIRKKIEASIIACKRGIPRVHIIGGKKNGSLIQEIFSCSGEGTMIYENQYRVIRNAISNEATDIADILRLSNPPFLISPGEIIKNIDQWHVFIVDDQAQGCMKFIQHSNDKSLEISFFTTSKSYENQETLKQMLLYAINEAGVRGCQTVFLEKTKAIIWLGLYPWLRKELEFQGSKKGHCVKCEPNEIQNIIWIRNLQEI